MHRAAAATLSLLASLVAACTTLSANESAKELESQTAAAPGAIQVVAINAEVGDPFCSFKFDQPYENRCIICKRAGRVRFLTTDCDPNRACETSMYGHEAGIRDGLSYFPCPAGSMKTH